MICPYTYKQTDGVQYDHAVVQRLPAQDARKSVFDRSPCAQSWLKASMAFFARFLADLLPYSLAHIDTITSCKSRTTSSANSVGSITITERLCAASVDSTYSKPNGASDFPVDGEHGNSRPDRSPFGFSGVRRRSFELACRVLIPQTSTALMRCRIALACNIRRY